MVIPRISSKIEKSYTADATFVIPGGEQVRGRREIMGLFGKLLDPNSKVEHIVKNTIIDGMTVALVVDVKVMPKDGIPTVFSEVNILEIKDNMINRAEVFFHTPLPAD